MATDLQAAITDELEELARLLSAIGDPNLSQQDADKLTDQMSQLIWDVSDLGPPTSPIVHSTTKRV